MISMLLLTPNRTLPRTIRQIQQLHFHPLWLWLKRNFVYHLIQYPGQHHSWRMDQNIQTTPAQRLHTKTTHPRWLIIQRPIKCLHKTSSQFPTHTITKGAMPPNAQYKPGKSLHFLDLFLWSHVTTHKMVPYPSTMWHHPKSPPFVQTPTKHIGIHMPIWKFLLQPNSTCRPWNKNLHPWNPQQQQTYVLHGIDSFYIGPS